MSENKRFSIDKDGRTILDNIDDSYCECVDSYEAKQYCEKLNELNDENTELKQVLMKVLNRLYNAESSLIYEYSTNIAEDEKQLQREWECY